MIMLAGRCLQRKKLTVQLWEEKRDLCASWGPWRWKLGQTEDFSRSGISNWTHTSITIFQYMKHAKSNNWRWMQMRNNTQGNHISGHTKSWAAQDSTIEVCRLSGISLPLNAICYLSHNLQDITVVAIPFQQYTHTTDGVPMLPGTQSSAPSAGYRTRDPRPKVNK